MFPRDSWNFPPPVAKSTTLSFASPIFEVNPDRGSKLSAILFFNAVKASPKRPKIPPVASVFSLSFACTSDSLFNSSEAFSLCSLSSASFVFASDKESFKTPTCSDIFSTASVLLVACAACSCSCNCESCVSRPATASFCNSYAAFAWPLA